MIVVHLDRLDPGHSTDAAVTVEALKAEVGSLYRLQILASQLEPQLVCPVRSPLLTPLQTLHEAAGEEGHGHEHDDGAADD